MFSSTNQYRPMIVSLKSEGSDGFDVNQEALFTGLLITKKGRLISGVEVFTGQSDPDRLGVPVISIKKPVGVVLHQNEDGVDKWLTIEGEDGTVASIIFSGSVNHQERHTYVEKLAYAFSERRGFAPGSDLSDWFNAKKAMLEVEQQFVQ